MVFIVSTKGTLFLKPLPVSAVVDRFVVMTLPRKGHKKIKESKGSLVGETTRKSFLFEHLVETHA